MECFLTKISFISIFFPENEAGENKFGPQICMSYDSMVIV
jgi:hypothetical protein